jgi:transposase
MLTAMTEEDWEFVVEMFREVRSRRGAKGRNDRQFLQALHYFVVNNLTWRGLPEQYGNWNTIWKRFWRLSQTGTFEAFFQALAACSRTAELAQMFDSTSIRAHVSAAGAKGGSRIRHSAAHGADLARKSTSNATSQDCRSTSTSPATKRVTAHNSKRCSTSGRT